MQPANGNSPVQFNHLPPTNGQPPAQQPPGQQPPNPEPPPQHEPVNHAGEMDRKSQAALAASVREKEVQAAAPKEVQAAAIADRFKAISEEELINIQFGDYSFLDGKPTDKKSVYIPSIQSLMESLELPFPKGNAGS